MSPPPPLDDADLGPGFDQPLHVGQLNLPPADEFRAAFEGIFERRFYTNHGPLAQALDEALADYLGVRHAISVTNGTAALMLMLRAMDLRGEVIVPAFTFPATVQSLVWAGLKPVFCDIDRDSQMLTSALVADKIGPDTSAILGVHIWGRGCDPVALESLAKARGVKLAFDAAHASGCTFQGRKIGGFGDAEIFSFHATKILNGAEGGCITTNDDVLAHRMRTMRSFHADDRQAPGFLRLNAKISEAQAAMALLALKHMPRYVAENLARYRLYQQGLAGIPGLDFIDYAAGEQSNYQFIVAAVTPARMGLTRDALIDILKSRNVLARRYFHPGVHHTPPFCDASGVDLPMTDDLCQALIQFPTGQGITHEQVEAICRLVRSAVARAGMA